MLTSALSLFTLAFAVWAGTDAYNDWVEYHDFWAGHGMLVTAVLKAVVSLAAFYTAFSGFLGIG